MIRRSRLSVLTAAPLVVVAAVLGALAFAQGEGLPQEITPIR